MNLEITAVAYGGKGIARNEGKVYFVAGTVPGDRVAVSVTHAGKQFSEAVVTEWQGRSELRGVSPCAYFGTCGGCQWLDIPGPTQAEWKQSFVTSALRRIGRVRDNIPLTFYAAPAALSYRNRITVKVSTNAAGVMQFGFFAAQSHQVIAIDRCAIADTAINTFLGHLAAVAPPPATVGMFQLEIMAASSRDQAHSGIIVTLYIERGVVPDGLAQFLVDLRSVPGVLWCDTSDAARGAPYFLWDQQFGINFLTKPAQFQQVNRAHNRSLRQLVYDEVSARGAQRILDLHCGGGNLSLALCNGSRSITGIETSSVAIASARESATAAGLTGHDYRIGDATAQVWQAHRHNEVYDLIIADPPREGMKDAVPALLKLAPPTIIYISCDPTTLARDLIPLTKARYQIVKLAAFDFFPNTYHVETVAVLERTGA